MPTLDYQPSDDQRRRLWPRVRTPAAWTMIAVGLWASTVGGLNLWINHDNPLVAWSDPFLPIMASFPVFGLFLAISGMVTLRRRPA